MMNGNKVKRFSKWLSILLVCGVMASSIGVPSVMAEEIPEEISAVAVYSTISTIVTGNDDMEQKNDGSLDLTSSDIELVWEKDGDKEQTVGLRFEDLHIPEGSTIESAYIQFTVDEDKNYGTPVIAIDAVDDVDVASFGTADNALTDLTTLGQSVTWSGIEAWTVEGDATEAQRTPDLSTLVQAVVDKTEWATDNAIAFILTGDGTRTAQSYEKGGSSKAAQLVVTYTNPDGPAPEPEVEVADYDASCITFTLGSDETELNFAWYSNTTTNVAMTAIVDVAKATDMTGTEFPEGSSTRFTGSCSAVSDTSADGVNTNKVTVTGLDKATDYVYRVGDGVDYSEVYPFTTGDSEDYSFFVVGDPQIGSSGVESNTIGWNDTMEKAVGAFSDTDFIVSAGDQVNTATSEEQYEGFFTPDELRELPLVTVQGNHDNASTYLDHFNNPNMSDTYGTTNAGGDYSFVYGDTLFIGINSNNTSGATHQAFVEEAVAANSDVKWKIVIFHHAIYSSASHSQQTSIVSLRQNLYPIFDDADIDMVLMGHDHCYTRTYQMEGNIPLVDQDTDASGAVVNPEGTLYMTLNSGSGSKYYTLKDAAEEYAAVREQLSVPTFSRVEVDEDSFTISTYRTDTMEMTDTYTVVKDEDYINPNNVRTTTSMIENSFDDIEEYTEDGTLDYDSSDLELTWEKDGSKEQIVGIRFETLEVPAGAEIVDAYIQFTVDEPNKNYGTPDYTISLIDSANAEGFKNEIKTVSSMTLSAMTVSWTDIPEWDTEHEAGVNQQTPDLSSLVQEIVDKDDWQKGNAIGFVISGDGTRTAESYDGGGSSQAPQLVVTYAIEENGVGSMRVDDEDVIYEEIDTLDYYYTLSDAEDINAIDITFEYDTELLTFVGVEVVDMDDVIEEVSVEDGKIRVVAGFLTPINTVDALDILKLSFNLLTGVDDEVSASVSVVEAYSAQVGVNDAVETNIEENEVEITVTSYNVLCDLTSDGAITINDLSLALEYYRATSEDDDWATSSIADVNRDGAVDVVDFALITYYIINN